jgi:hypothetical protein
VKANHLDAVREWDENDPLDECAAVEPDPMLRMTPYRCSRPEGHGGWHVALNEDCILAVWDDQP